jgi:hypothetical protein
MTCQHRRHGLAESADLGGLHAGFGFGFGLERPVVDYPTGRQTGRPAPHIVSVNSSVVVSPSVMMPSASAPSVVMTSPAVTHVAMTVTVTAPDLDDRSGGVIQRPRCRNGHCRGGYSGGNRQRAGGKSS